jgi:hypothetical protein
LLSFIIHHSAFIIFPRRSFMLKRKFTALLLLTAVVFVLLAPLVRA